MKTFDEAFQTFFAGTQKISHDYHDKNFPNIPKAEFSFSKGRKYIRIVCNGSAHAFVDTTNGDVLKPASWKTPAKHARGNIFDASNGLASMGPYGPAYMR